MPNLKSSCKRALLSEKRRLINKAHISTIKTLMKKILTATVTEDQKTKNSLIALTYSKIDKAVRKGIIHMNSGNSKKSMIAMALKKYTPPSK